MIALILTLSALADQPDTGPVECYEDDNELYDSFPVDGQLHVPTDVAPAFSLSEACADGEEGTHSWTLVNEDTDQDVASGAVVSSLVDGLASPEGWVALEPSTRYRLTVWAQPGDILIEGGSFVFTTGTGPSAGEVQPPTLGSGYFGHGTNYHGEYVHVRADVTPWFDPETMEAIVEIGSPDHPDHTRSPKFVSHHHATSMGMQFNTTPLPIECFITRQRGATGLWSEWSEPLCGAPVLEVEEEVGWFGCLGGSRGAFLLLPLPLLALASRRRGRPRPDAPSAES